MAARKTGNDDSKARQRLLDATVKVMIEQGYAAATSRRIAAEAGVKQALVYYYFPTMDDLFVHVLRSHGEGALDRMRAAITADDPLRALWVLNSDETVAVLSAEFVALANHRKVIRDELRSFAERVRDIETAAATVALRTRGVDLDAYPPVAVSMLIAQIARSLCNERAVGFAAGHDAMLALVERQLEALAAYSPNDPGPS